MNNVSKLSLNEMENIAGGGCVTGKANGVITGFCVVGSFLNVFAAIGCAGYATYQYFNCA